MDELRKSLFVVSLVLALLIVLVAAGAKWFPQGDRTKADPQKIAAQLKEVDADLLKHQASVSQELKNTPPGVAIADMALLDGLLLYSVCLMGASFLLTDRLIGRIQGVITL